MIGKDLTEFEIEILKVKYKSKRFSEMSEFELPVAFELLLSRINVITGWKLPDDDIYLEILVDEFSKLMLEQYKDLNPDEVAFAFRNYGTEIKDWGKSMNLSLISEPISSYLQARRVLSKLEEDKSGKHLLTQAEPITNDEELIETVKSVFLKTNLTGLIPTKVYDILIERKLINLEIEDKKNIREYVEEKIKNQAMTEGVQAMKDYKALKAVPHEYELQVRNECKRVAVAKCFILQNQIDNF